MRATGALSRPGLTLATLVGRLTLGLASLGLAAFASLAIFILGVRTFYIDRALPGVSVAGVNVSGMNQAEIGVALGEALAYPQSGLIVLRDQGRVWTARPAELGAVIDLPTMARHALAIGRSGGLGERVRSQVEAWYRGVPLAPIVVFDQRLGATYLETLAAVVDRPQVEATLELNGLEIVMHPGQIGRRLNIQANLDAIEPSLARMFDAEVTLVVEETPPLVLDASEQAEIARQIISQPLRLTAEGAGPWEIDPRTLAEMLTFNVVEGSGGGHYEVGLDPQRLAAFLEPLAPELERKPENARFIFNDDTRQLDLLREATIGRTLDIPATIQALNTGLVTGKHELPLVFRTTEPDVTSDATAAELGITEAVSVVSTYFYGSSSERIQNIKTASSAFHGLLIAPGGTLSMAEVLGDISLDTGYAEALIIYGDRTIKGVGGGVCQVSTTLFRAAFFGGYELVERNPHAYRVGYYEQGPGSPGPGLDATVFVPLVDFKFTNDTPFWLLMETYVYGNQLLWKFYSSSDGRVVQVSRPQTSNIVEAPKPLWKENPELAKGEKRQVDYEADGMDVVVTRTVTRDGQQLHQDVIKTHYLPWREIWEFGPGTKVPKDVEVEKS